MCQRRMPIDNSRMHVPTHGAMLGGRVAGVAFILRFPKIDVVVAVRMQEALISRMAQGVMRWHAAAAAVVRTKMRVEALSQPEEGVYRSQRQAMWAIAPQADASVSSTPHSASSLRRM